VVELTVKRTKGLKAKGESGDLLTRNPCSASTERSDFSHLMFTSPAQTNQKCDMKGTEKNKKAGAIQKAAGCFASVHFPQARHVSIQGKRPVNPWRISPPGRYAGRHDRCSSLLRALD
jgi:hypothetical protein